MGETKGRVMSASTISVGKIIDGLDSNLYIRFSEFPDGRGMTSEPTPKSKYIGVVSTKETRPPAEPARYIWSVYRGEDGQESFMWVRYSEKDNGLPSMQSVPTAKTEFMGVYTGPESSAPTVASKYKWVRTKGENGESSFIHVKYSDNEDGTGFYDKPKKTTMYIGVTVSINKTAPTDKKAYDWSDFGANIEFGGRNYILDSLKGAIIKRESAQTWKTLYDAKRFSKDLNGYTGFLSFSLKAKSGEKVFPPGIKMRLVGLTGTTRTYTEEFTIQNGLLKQGEFIYTTVLEVPEKASTANSYLIEYQTWTQAYDLTTIYAQLERGNRPSDWSGAPEDVNSEIMEINKNAASLELLIKKVESGKASTAEVKLLADQMKFMIRSDTSYGGVRITDQGVTMESPKMDIRLDATVGFQINKKTEPKRTVFGVDNDGNLVINAANIEKDIKDTQKKIDDIEVGGRNLLPGTREMDYIGRHSEKSKEEYIKGFTVLKTKIDSSIWGEYRDTYNQRTTQSMPAGSYTLSFWGKASKNLDANAYFYGPNTTIKAESSTGQTSVASDGSVGVSFTKEWKKYWVKWEQKETLTPKEVIIGRISNTGTDQIFITQAKLEEGNMATGWQSALEDARIYEAWSNSPDGKKDFTTVRPERNLFSKSYIDENGGFELDGETIILPDGGWAKTLVPTERIQDILQPSKKYSAQYTFELLSKTAGTVPHSKNTHGKIILHSGVSGYPTINITEVSEAGVNEWTVGTKVMRSGTFTTPANLLDPQAKYRLLSYTMRSMVGEVEKAIEKGSFHNFKIEENDFPTGYTASPVDNPSNSAYRFLGTSAQNSQKSEDYTWQQSPEHNQVMTEYGLMNKIGLDEYELDREEIVESIGDKASLDELKEIENEVSDIKNSYNEFLGENGQYSSDLSSLENRLQTMITNLGATVARYNFIKTYMTMGEEGFLIGSEDSQTKTLFSDDKISFYDGGVEVAYIAGQEFRIARGTILSSLQVGGHMMEEIDEENTVFTYVGKPKEV